MFLMKIFCVAGGHASLKRSELLLENGRVVSLTARGQGDRDNSESGPQGGSWAVRCQGLFARGEILLLVPWPMAEFEAVYGVLVYVRSMPVGLDELNQERQSLMRQSVPTLSAVEWFVDRRMQDDGSNLEMDLMVEPLCQVAGRLTIHVREAKRRQLEPQRLCIQILSYAAFGSTSQPRRILYNSTGVIKHDL